MAPPTFRTFLPQNAILHSCDHGKLQSQASCKVNRLQTLLKPKSFNDRNMMTCFCFNRTFCAKTKHISSVNVAEIAKVDGQLSTRMARPSSFIPERLVSLCLQGFKCKTRNEMTFVNNNSCKKINK